MAKRKKKKNRRGRPRLLNANAIKVIHREIRKYNVLRQAAAAIGAGYLSLRGWIIAGENDIASGKQTLFAKLVQAIEEARGLWIADRLKNIQKAGKAGDWKAEGFLLERQMPQEFGQRFRVDAGQVDDEIDRQLERLAYRGPDAPALPAPEDSEPGAAGGSGEANPQMSDGSHATPSGIPGDAG